MMTTALVFVAFIVGFAVSVTWLRRPDLRGRGRIMLDRRHPFVFNGGRGGFLGCQTRTLVVPAVDGIATCPDCGQLLRRP